MAFEHKIICHCYKLHWHMAAGSLCVNGLKDRVSSLNVKYISLIHIYFIYLLIQKKHGRRICFEGRQRRFWAKELLIKRARESA